MNLRSCFIACGSLLLLNGEAAAHSIGTIYTLPIPFWMYAFAASAALALSFVMVGFFVTVQSTERNFRSIDIPTFVPGAARMSVRGLSVFLLALTMATGLFGTPDPFSNFSLTFFWIGFVLALAYLTAVIGDVYALINPWRVLCDAIEHFVPGAFRARIRYPGWLAYYPALALYMAFIWLELFGHATPRMLGILLLGYSLLNLGGATVFGVEPWFRYGEFFAVFFRLLGRIAPIAYAVRGPKITVRLRQPFVGLIEESADHPSLIIFVLFMLSSTAFDGVHETLPWVQVFWKNIYPVVSALIARPYVFFVGLYYDWQWAMLWLSPFIYLGIYLFFIGLMKLVTGSPQPLRALALRFAYSLIPIAFVYNVTHYYTLLVTDAPRLLLLISDPFGAGWNLFGTATIEIQPLILPADAVWHTQVGLILFGHIVSVYLAHAQALRIFPAAVKVLWSQFPMLILMVALTTAGLWILSLPIAAGQVQDPIPASSLPPSARDAAHWAMLVSRTRG